MATGLMGIDSGPRMNWDAGADLYTRYRRWKQKVQTMFEGPLHGETEAVQCKYLLIWFGDHCMDQFNSWGLSEQEKKLLKNYWTKFEEYVNPQANYLIARHKLTNLEQGEWSLEEFLTEIRLKASSHIDDMTRHNSLRHDPFFHSPYN